MSRGASRGAPLHFFREGCPPCDRISMACRYSTCTSTLEQSHVYQKEGNSIDHPTSLSHHEHNRLLHVRLGCLLSAVSMSAYYFHFCDFNYVIFILTLFSECRRYAHNVVRPGCTTNDVCPFHHISSRHAIARCDRFHHRSIHAALISL